MKKLYVQIKHLVSTGRPEETLLGWRGVLYSLLTKRWRGVQLIFLVVEKKWKGLQLTY
jgi:hypothetical protein